MCINPEDADPKLRPFVASPVAILSPALYDHVDVSPSCENAAADEVNKSTGRRRIILYSLLALCMMGGSFLAGMLMHMNFVSTTAFQYDDNNLSTEIANDGVALSPGGKTRVSSMHTTSSADRDEAVDEVVSVPGLLRNQKKSNTDTRIIDMINYYYKSYRRIDHTFLSYLASSSFARDQIIESMVNEYTSKMSPEVTMKDRLKNSIEVLNSRERDGEPVVVEGHEFLFVGSVGAAMNEESLRSNGITHIINWSSTAKCNSFDDFEYLCFPGIRNHSDMKEHIEDLDKAVEFIESARQSGGKALSHCWFGKNRSVTLLVAYLMKYEGMTSSDAIELIQRTRSIADPYLDVLHLYEKSYLKQTHHHA